MGQKISALPQGIPDSLDLIPYVDVSEPNPLLKNKATPFSSMASAVTGSVFSWLSVKDVRFGATGDGTTDDAPAIQAAIDYAIANKIGSLWFPAAIYRCYSALDIPGGILLQGAGSPGSSSGGSQAMAALFHDFSGDFLTWSDQNGTGVLMGGGIDRIALVQNYGASGGAVCGKAISVVAPATGSVQAWMRWTNMQVEQFSYAAPWTYCMDADGTANAILLRDWWFSNIRFAAGTGATGGLRLAGMVNCFLQGVELNNAATIIVTGDATHRSSNVNFSGCSCAGNFHIDFADTVLVTGGNYTTWSNTANTGAAGTPCVLLPAYSANLLTNNAGANCLFAVYNTSNGLRYQQPVTEDNGVFFSGMTVAAARKRLIGISVSDLVNIDPDGLGVRFGAGATMLGSLYPSPDATHDLGSGSFRWRQLVLSGQATIGGLLLSAASVAGAAGLRIPHGVAPTAPVNGDVWTTTAGMFVRAGGVTYGPFTGGGVSGSGSAGKLAKFSAASVLADSIVSESGAALSVAGSIKAVTNQIILDNTYHYSALTTGAVVKRLLGISSVDEVQIDLDALGARFGAGAVFAGSLFPNVNATYDLGSGSFRWRQLVLSGQAIIGGLLSTVASVAGAAGVRIPHGTAPSAPVDGDMWTTTAGFYARINGVTVGPLAAGTVLGSGSAGKLAKFSAASTLADSILSEAGAVATIAGELDTKRVSGTGTTHVVGDYALSAGWGTTASVSTLSARDSGGRVAVTCGGTGIAANPTITLTFKDGTWGSAPALVAGRGDVVLPSTTFRLSAISATVAVFTFYGTPVAGSIYILDWLAVGK